MTTATRDWHARARELNIDGRALIGGQRVASVSGETFACHSPIDGRLLGAVARGRAADIDAAVSSARSAFDDGRWAQRAPAQRKKVLQAFAEKIDPNQDLSSMPGCQAGALQAVDEPIPELAELWQHAQAEWA